VPPRLGWQGHAHTGIWIAALHFLVAARWRGVLPAGRRCKRRVRGARATERTDPPGVFPGLPSEVTGGRPAEAPLPACRAGRVCGHSGKRALQKGVRNALRGPGTSPEVSSDHGPGT